MIVNANKPSDAPASAASSDLDKERPEATKDQARASTWSGGRGGITSFGKMREKYYFSTCLLQIILQ